MMRTASYGIVTFAAAFLLAGAAFAATDKTTQDLYYECSDKNPANEIACVRYLDGVASTMMFSASLLSELKDASPQAQRTRYILGLCPGSTITAGQMRQVFINWAKRNPKSWQQIEFAGAFAALREAWPCLK